MRALRLVPLLLCLALLASCASTPPAGEASLDIGLRKAEKADYERFGWGFSNPYIPFKGLFLDQLFGRGDFLVLKAEFDAPQRTKLQLLGVQAAQEGLTFYDRAKFTEFWDAFDGFEQDINLRRSRIASTYFPPDEFMTRKGDSSYFIVLVGKYPLKGPFDIRADFLVNGERREVELHLD